MGGTEIPLRRSGNVSVSEDEEVRRRQNTDRWGVERRRASLAFVTPLMRSTADRGNEAEVDHGLHVLRRSQRRAMACVA
jgi:hypothetical protein